jgi:tetratricopeptide (TPR) repeat protein
MQSQPDSALTVLLDEPTDEPYYQLLLSEALYKNDYAQTNRDELLVAMAYFDSVNDPFLAARCHYMNGVGFYEMDSVVPACEEYMKAIQIMEEHYPENELVGLKAKYMALAYTKLTKLFSDQYLEEQSISFGKHALVYYQKYDAALWHVAWILDNIGSCYHIMNQLDSANYYIDKALAIISDTNTMTYRDLIVEKCLLSYQQGLDSQIVLKQIHRVISQAENERELLARYYAIGYLFYQEKTFDSAIKYLEPVYQRIDYLSAKKKVAQYLMDIYKSQGKNTEALDCSDFLAPFSTIEEDNGGVKSQLSEMYRNFNLLQFERTHLFKTKRLIKTIVTLTGLIVLFFLLILASHFLFKRKLMTRELKYSAVLEKAKKSIETLQNENHILKKKKSFHDLPKANNGDYNALMKEGICVNIKQRVKQMEKFSSFDVKSYHSLYLTKKELSELYLIIDKYCPNFSERLLDKYPSLNTGDLKLCRLYLLDLSIIQVAVLLDTDYSSIRKRTNRLKEKTGCIELSQQLKSLIFE